EDQHRLVGLRRDLAPARGVLPVRDPDPCRAQRIRRPAEQLRPGNLLADLEDSGAQRGGSVGFPEQVADPDEVLGRANGATVDRTAEDELGQLRWVGWQLIQIRRANAQLVLAVPLVAWLDLQRRPAVLDPVVPVPRRCESRVTEGLDNPARSVRRDPDL